MVKKNRMVYVARQTNGIRLPTESTLETDMLVSTHMAVNLRWILTANKNGPHVDRFSIEPVVDSEGETLREEAVVAEVDGMDTGIELK